MFENGIDTPPSDEVSNWCQGERFGKLYTRDRIENIPYQCKAILFEMVYTLEWNTNFMKFEPVVKDVSRFVSVSKGRGLGKAYAVSVFAVIDDGGSNIMQLTKG